LTPNIECYFCHKKDRLKSIWLESDVEELKENQELADLPKRSCCFDCFNNPDNGIENSPVEYHEWSNTNYDWGKKVIQ